MGCVFMFSGVMCCVHKCEYKVTGRIEPVTIYIVMLLIPTAENPRISEVKPLT